MTGTALRARLLCVLAASAAACAPGKEAPPPQPVAPAATTAAPDVVRPPAPPPMADAAPPTPAPSEVLTSGPAPPSPAPAPVGTCDKPEKRCFAPRTNTSGGMVRIDLSKEPFDANGCLPQERVGGSCAGFRARSGARFQGGKCCYDGCASQPAPCGRPLIAAGGGPGGRRAKRLGELSSASGAYFCATVFA